MFTTQDHPDSRSGHPGRATLGRRSPDTLAVDADFGLLNKSTTAPTATFFLSPLDSPGDLWYGQGSVKKDPRILLSLLVRRTMLAQSRMTGFGWQHGSLPHRPTNQSQQVWAQGNSVAAIEFCIALVWVLLEKYMRIASC